MKYEEMFKEDNEAVKERHELSMERISSIRTERTTAEPFRSYFSMVADFICMVDEVYKELGETKEGQATFGELEAQNQTLFGDIMPDHYGISYGNPSYAAEQLGEEFGGLLCYLYAEIRGQIVFAYERRLTEITILNELFIEIYNLFEGEIPTAQAVKDIIYYFVFDYCDFTQEYRIRENLDPSLTFAKDIITDSDLTDLRYLYQYGEYISKAEIEIADFLNSLPEETINLMADTYTRGYQKGFEVMGRDLSKKSTVVIRFEIGFERMVRKAMENFKEMGLETVIYRNAVWSIDRNPTRNVGYFASSPNKQYDYDHRYDNAVYMNKAIKDRRVSVLKVAYEMYKKEAEQYAGPALIETFGEEGFKPVNKKEAMKLTDKQEQAVLAMTSEISQLSNQYVPGGETSFTIIAFPTPAIGENFSEIFNETIRINTLDYETYKKIQQAVIDVLDQASYVEVKGAGNNRTDLKISLRLLSDKTKETNFENCLADVNIPLGEVFTSPALKGTEGILHVGSVYIGEIQFKNLAVEFKDGMICGYSCENFEDANAGKELVKQLILKNHDSLPMGEFAIGTNTTAYAMARSFGIVDRLPILIVEKMGPHFAVGDTCYSWAEDSPVYNSDGKEVVARDNEISLLRKEDISKAYFNCHTDITIPYDELDSITAVTETGERLPIITNGKFAVSGTEELNKPLT